MNKKEVLEYWWLKPADIDYRTMQYLIQKPGVIAGRE
jgi:hypothetical protein